jgi:hypothetical protein
MICSHGSMSRPGCGRRHRHSYIFRTNCSGSRVGCFVKELQAARLPLQRKAFQKNLQRAKGILVTARPFALPRAGDIQDLDLVFAHEISNQLRAVFSRNFRCVDKFVRTLKLLATLNREFRSATQLCKVNDDRAIGILHVLECALGKTPVLQFFERITTRNSAELIHASGRTPAATFDPMFQGNV